MHMTRGMRGDTSMFRQSVHNLLMTSVGQLTMVFGRERVLNEIQRPVWRRTFKQRFRYYRVALPFVQLQVRTFTA